MHNFKNLFFLIFFLAGQIFFPGQSASAFIRVDPEYPHSFKFDNGERYFPMGDTSYCLLAETESNILQYLDSREQNNFNFIRVGAMCDGHWPFGGTPAGPDYTTINESAMQKLDWLFDQAASRGINIELIIWTYGVGGGEGLWGNSTNENFWVDTLVDRYKERSNLFMYTIANEFERYPDGNYSYSSSDVDWARNIAARISNADPVHAIGVHPSIWMSNIPPYSSFLSYGGTNQHLPQRVWPLWQSSSVSVQNVQNNQGVQIGRWSMSETDCGVGITGCVVYESTDWQGSTYPATWTSGGWDIEGAGMEDSIAEDWSEGKPVINTEFGYQFESGAVDPTRQLHLPSTVRKKAWKIATAGGYFSAGFAHSWNHLNDIDNWRPAQLQALHNFFTTKTEYWKMAPHLESVSSQNSLLALPGEEYIAYFPRGGTNYIDLQPGTYQAEWLNPESGTYFESEGITSSGGNYDFTPPENISADWVLHLWSDTTAPGAPSRLAVR
jgi:hypothetical protein